MESVSKSDTAKRTSEGPNIIGNEEGGARMPPINFRAWFPQEDAKRDPDTEKLSLDQFTRKVSSKRDLIYTLTVKGKSKLSRSFFPPVRSNVHA